MKFFYKLFCLAFLIHKSYQFAIMRDNNTHHNNYIEPINGTNNLDAPAIDQARFINTPIDSGVPVEFRYNQTNFESDTNRSSVPGCPMAVGGLPWVYFGSPAKCFLTGFQGPCPVGSVLLSKGGSTYGSCVCECLYDTQYETHHIEIFGNFIHCKANGYEGKEETWNGQIYDKKERKCYNIGRNETCSVLGAVEGMDFISCHGIEAMEHYKLVPLLQNAPHNDSGDPISHVKDSDGMTKTQSSTRTGGSRPPSAPRQTFNILPFVEKDCRVGFRYSRILQKCIFDLRGQNVG